MEKSRPGGTDRGRPTLAHRSGYSSAWSEVLLRQGGSPILRLEEGGYLSLQGDTIRVVASPGETKYDRRPELSDHEKVDPGGMVVAR